MNQQDQTNGHLPARYQQVTLLELLDRLLDTGVVVKGEILLSVADVDLIYLNLGLLLSSVKAVQQTTGSRQQGEHWEAALLPRQTSPHNELCSLDSPNDVSENVLPAPAATNQSQGKNADRELMASALPPVVDDELDALLAPRTNIDPAKVEKGLAKLVLTLVNLIRKLMENQAVRRMDEGQLLDSDIERLGSTFYLLDQKMAQLKKIFDLEDEDLNLDLGPLGELV